MISGGVIEAADCFVARWLWDEVGRSWLRHAVEDASRVVTRGGVGRGQPPWYSCRQMQKERMIDRVARYRFD